MKIARATGTSIETLLAIAGFSDDAEANPS
jgi:hypothetical protein